MELDARLDALMRQGWQVAAISYDSREVLSAFALRHGIDFPLLSDPGSSVIRRYGLLNTEIEPGTSAFGVPYPGTLMLDRSATVVARSFEERYQERETAGALTSRVGLDPPTESVRVSSRHLEATVSVSDGTVAPGHRFLLRVDIAPAPGMHIYAPGVEGYRPLRVTVDPAPELRVGEPRYPPSQLFEFKPLNEVVSVYTRPFRVTVPVTLEATATQARMKTSPSIRLSGRLDYQACDAAVCYNPTSVPFAVNAALRPLLRGR